MVALLPLVLVPLILPALYGSTGDDIDAFQAETLRGLGRSFLADFTTPVLIQGALLVAMGFLLVFIAVLLRNPNEAEEEMLRGAVVAPPGYPMQPRLGSTPTFPPLMSSTPSPTPSLTPNLPYLPQPPALPSLPSAPTPPLWPGPPTEPPGQADGEQSAGSANQASGGGTAG
ncbi:MAG: hypothetical protein HC915_05825 [Anaerolineae bacterium]|nr:hypothetical protein [Anaerolineae bacterium]